MHMGKRLYCGNLPYSATADDVKEIFSEGGRTVVDVHVVTDRETGRPRGFAFVEMSTVEEAAEAIKALDGATFQGRQLGVKEARERQPRVPGAPRIPRPPFEGDRHPGRFEVPPEPGPRYEQRRSEAPSEYGPPEDVDYRERGDRGRRGRDRRGGRRRGHDFDPGW